MHRVPVLLVHEIYREVKRRAPLSSAGNVSGAATRRDRPPLRLTGELGTEEPLKARVRVHLVSNRITSYAQPCRRAA